MVGPFTPLACSVAIGIVGKSRVFMMFPMFFDHLDDDGEGDDEGGIHMENAKSI
jgi:hypothetical protein